MGAVRRLRSGDRVETACIKRVASQEATDSQPRPFRESKSFNGLFGIARTGRVETAVLPEEWAQEQAIQANKPGGETSGDTSRARSLQGVISSARLHNRFHCLSSVSNIAALSISARPVRASTTISRGGMDACRRRKLSRIRRLRRLRWTASLTCFLAITSPKRACPSWFGLAISRAWGHPHLTAVAEKTLA